MIYHYIRSFLKSLKKNRFFYAINLIGFITGFLVITIIFTFVYQELSFDRFHQNAPNIFRIHPEGYGVTPLCFGEKLKNRIPEITGIVRFSSKDLTIVFENKEVTIGKTYYTDPEIFQILSYKLLSGDASNALKAPFSIVINKSTANKLYGDRSSLGETFHDKEGTIYTIAGIMEDIPYNSHIQSNAFISIETLRHAGDNNVFNCSTWSSLTYVRLSEYSDRKATEGKINSILEDSKMGTSDGKIPLILQPLRKVYFDSDNNKYDGSEHGNLQTVLLYLAISVLILLIVIINYINLSTAISGSRIKEISIRKINGAERIQIVKQIMLESVVVALTSFIISLLVIELYLPQLSRLLNLSVSASLIKSFWYKYYFTGIVSIGIITGLVPGIILSKINEIEALNNESVFSSRGIQRKILVAFQLLIVSVLLNSGLIINRQISYVFKRDMGFRYENVISFNLNKSLQDKSELFKNTLLKNSGIETVSFSDGLIGDQLTKRPVSIGDVNKLCNFNSIDPDYLTLYRIKLKYGRNFSSDLKTDIKNTCILNEEACKAFGNENPVGKLLGNIEIIGVVYNFNFTSLHNAIEPLVMNYASGKIVQIKISAGKQEETLNYIDSICKNISPGFECNFSFLDSRIRQLYKSDLDLKSSFAVYSIITLIIALLGLFGLTLFTVKKKIKEVIIRKLFGARLKDTIKLLTREQVIIVIISNILAMPITLLIMFKWLDNFRYKTDISFLIFLETFLITITFTLFTVLFLILKTHRLNLIENLKHE